MTIKLNILATTFAALVALSYNVAGQEVNGLLKEAARLEELKKENDAFRKYIDALKVQPNNLVALCKASELSSLIGNRQSSKSAKLDYFKAARRYAETALHVNPNYAEANFVMSMAMGRMALILSGREKIAAVIDIKKYAENAIRNDPKNFKSYHVLGRWHYEVSNLNGFERVAAKLLFGGLPPSSYAESIRYYEKSRSLKPDFAINYLEVAKVYHKNKQDNKAIEVLKKLELLPVKAADDPQIKKEGSLLLKELQ